MNSEPCVRFGMRISPKISEKPADSRNSRPPKVMLLTASTSQKFIAADCPAPAARGEQRAPSVAAPAVLRAVYGFSGG